MTATIINGILALILGTYAIKYRNTSYVIFILFIYISLHYSYSAIAIFGSLKYVYIRTNTQIGAKIIGFGFLLFTAGLIVFTKRRTIWSAIQAELTSRIYFAVIIWLAAVGVAWIFEILHGNYPSSLALQDIVSVFIMLGLAFIIAAVLPDFYMEDSFSWQRMLQILLCLVILMDVVSLYQIAAGKTFAADFNLTGEYAQRTCALLLNPNLYGLWCVFIASVAAYAFHIKCPKITASLAIGLAALGVFLSGSRSGLLIGLFMLGLVSLLQFKFRRWNDVRFSFYPLFIYIASLTGIGILFKILDSLSNSSFKWLHLLSMLTDRFAEMPGVIGTYAVLKFMGYTGLVFKWCFDITDYYKCKHLQATFLEIATNIHASFTFTTIDGRMNPAISLPDNGYLAMFHDTGWLGLLAWLVLWMLIVGVGVKSFRKNPGMHNVYALSAICTCLFSALMIRSFQVYPIWVIVSIVLGISMGLFQAGLSQKGFSEHP
jgi:hypothetical protein